MSDRIKSKSLITMAYGELTFAPEYKGINKKTGQYLKGHTPANKGKRWDEYMGKRAQKRFYRDI